MRKIPFSGFKVLFILIAGFSAYRSVGQDAKIVPPTPNAMKMTEYYSQRPNMYTGTANVNIPLHTIDFDGWNLSLSLSYNATGVRTNEEAGEIGLGWALNATGVISRTIRGTDDLFPGSNNNLAYEGYVYNLRPVTYSMGYDWKTDPTGHGPADTSYYFHLAQASIDTQPDIFSYNFFGFSGSFVLSQKYAAADTIVRVVKITQDACSISFNQWTKTFSVITPDGFRGDFTVLEKSTTFSAGIPTNNRMNCCGQNNLDQTALFNTGNPSGQLRIATSWYLSKITSPHNQVINFNYDLSIVPSSGTSLGSTYLPGNVYSPYLSNTRAFGETELSSGVTACIQTVQEHVYLKSIYYAFSDSVIFSMETREDLRRNYLFTPDSNSATHEFPNSKPLQRYTGVRVKGLNSQSTLNKNITFVQSYFNGGYQDQTPDNQKEVEVRWLRSRLDRISIDDQEYRFFYEKGSLGLPSKLTTGIDHFGFYNGADANTILIPPIPYPETASFVGGGVPHDTLLYQTYQQMYNRLVDFDYGKAGLLTKMEYPTRGYTVFAYEPHLYMVDTIGYRFYENVNAGGTKAGGARIQSIKEYGYDDVLIQSKSYQYVIDTVSGPVPSGRLMTPLYNRYSEIFWDPVTLMAFSLRFQYKSYSTIPGNSSAEGKIIGYSSVRETVTGSSDSYQNYYYFENTPNRVKGFNAITVGYPNLNGQVTEIRNYDSQGKLLKRVENKGYYHRLDSVICIAAERMDPKGNWPKYIVRYALPRTFVAPDSVITTVADQLNNGMTVSNKDVVTLNSGLVVKKSTLYNKSYLPSYEGTVNSMGDSVTTRYYRPADYDTVAHTVAPAVKYMMRKNVNIVNPVIEQITKKNGKIFSAVANSYLLQSGMANLGATYQFNWDPSTTLVPSTDATTFSSLYTLVTTYSKYDGSTGKLREYTGRDGITHSFVWAYGGMLPVVHGVGVGYDTLLLASNNAGTLGTPTYETALRSNPSLAGKLITTYTHNPGIGVTRITDPAGTKKTFQYDKYGRLQTASDNNGALIGQNMYHMRERTVTKTLTLSGNVNFGTLTPDMFATQFIYYARCSDGIRTQILRVSNTGDEDLTVTLSIPYFMTSSWSGGFISSGNYVDVILSFNTGVGLGTYSGSIVATFDSVLPPVTVTGSVIYANRANNISFPSVVDFGTVTSSYNYRDITITNSGNAPLRLSSLVFNWDGNPAHTASNTDPSFSTSVNPQCIGGPNSFAQSMTIRINFIPPANGTMSTKLTLFFDDGTVFQDGMLLKGIKN